MEDVGVGLHELVLIRNVFESSTTTVLLILLVINFTMFINPYHFKKWHYGL